MVGLASLFYILFCFNVSASAMDLTVESVTNKLFNDLREQGAFSNLDQNEIDIAQQNLKNDVENRLELVKSGELSLDPNAPNYFLLDTIKNVVTSVVQGVKTIAGKVWNTFKGVLGTVVDVGLGFLGMADNDFIKGVISAAATAFSKFAPIVGDFISFIPVAGPVISMVIDAVAPFADVVVNPTTLDMVTGGISAAANAIGITKDAIASATSSSLAPSPLIFDSMSAAPAQASAADKTKAIAGLGVGCKKLMDYLSGLTPAAYNALAEKHKLAAAQCNQLAKEANAKVGG